VAESAAACVGLHCRDCGYDLRGLSDDAACPECGLAVAESKRPGHLFHGPPAWLRRLRWGSLSLLVGVVCCAAAGMAEYSYLWFYVINGRVELTMIWVVQSGVLALLFGASYWLLTSPSLSPRAGEEAERRLARWLGVGACACGFASTCVLTGLWVVIVGGVGEVILSASWMIAYSAGVLVTAVAEWFLIAHAIRLAERGQRERLVAATRRVRILYFAALAATLADAALAMSIELGAHALLLSEAYLWIRRVRYLSQAILAVAVFLLAVRYHRLFSRAKLIASGRAAMDW